MDNTETDQGAPAQTNFKIGLEDILEDFFGLNMRSFRSLKTLFLRPAAYLNSAKSVNWQDSKFTPSPRLWLGLTAIIVALRVIWGSEDSAYMKSIVDSVRSGDNSNFDPATNWNDIATQVMDFTTLFSPIATITTLLLLASLLRFWGEKLTYFTRLRFLFAAMIPVPFLSIIYYLAASYIPVANNDFFSALYFVVAFGLITWVISQGGMQHHKGVGKWLRSILMSTILCITTFITEVIVLFAAMYFAIMPLY